MTTNIRLRISAIMIILSALYGVVVAQSTELASALAVGYIAVFLTGIFLLNVWKRP